MKRFSYAFTTATLILLIGCVVIPDTFEAHIVIDVRVIAEQADNFLDYVEGKTESLSRVSTDGETSEESSLLWRTLEFISPIQVAYAQEFKDTSPRVNQIADKMRERNPELTTLKKTGAVGENNRGLVELARPEIMTDSEARNAAQRLIAAENEDRKALYKEITRLNKDQELNVATLERVYAQRRLERSSAGELFQLPPAGEDFDTFKSSAKGRALGGECVAESWVVIK